MDKVGENARRASAMRCDDDLLALVNGALEWAIGAAATPRARTDRASGNATSVRPGAR